MSGNDCQLREDDSRPGGVRGGEEPKFIDLGSGISVLLAVSENGAVFWSESFRIILSSDFPKSLC